MSAPGLYSLNICHYIQQNNPVDILSVLVLLDGHNATDEMQ